MPGDDLDFDVNKIAADYVIANQLAILAIAGDGIKKVTNAVRTRVTRTYAEYLVKVLDRYSKAKSFLIRTEPLPLYDFFVPMDLSTQHRTLARATASDIADVNPHAIIVGSGGSGKSLFMRHVVVGCIASKCKTPVFVELRQLTRKSGGLLSAVYETLTTQGLKIDRDFLERGLVQGHFCFVLDGFDELEFDMRPAIVEEISEIAIRYPNNWIVLSSRPDDALNKLDTFTQFQVMPLDLETAVELVRRLPFENPVSQAFIKEMEAGMFETHKSFLSNPLLLSIMLLTYSDVAHIPSKLSLFYSQAYESLFLRHDALKGVFQRQRHTSLDMNEFASAFSAFCLYSYDGQKVTFTRAGALQLMERGKQLSQVKYDNESLLADCEQAVCLLLEDGLDIVFAHRSFQEYFVARFIEHANDETKKALIERYALRVESDAVLDLLYDLDRRAVEDYYIRPLIEKLRTVTKLKRQVGYTQYLRFVRRMWSKFKCARRPKLEISSTVKDPELFRGMMFLRRLGLLGPHQKNESRAWNRTAASLIPEAPDNNATGGVLHLSALVTSSEFLRHLATSTDPMWSIQGLRAVFVLESDIERSRCEVEESLEHLLESRATASVL